MTNSRNTAMLVLSGLLAVLALVSAFYYLGPVAMVLMVCSAAYGYQLAKLR